MTTQSLRGGGEHWGVKGSPPMQYKCLWWPHCLQSTIHVDVHRYTGWPHQCCKHQSPLQLHSTLSSGGKEGSPLDQVLQPLWYALPDLAHTWHHHFQITCSTHFHTSSYHVYVPAAHASQMINLLYCEGWYLVEAYNQAGDEYMASSVQQVLFFWRCNHRINVIISATDAAISPMFKFHSTVMMNFNTANATCCAHLTLLLQEKSIVNLHTLPMPSPWSNLASWEKYTKERGIKFTCCPCTGGSQTGCTHEDSWSWKHIQIECRYQTSHFVMVQMVSKRYKAG